MSESLESLHSAAASPPVPDAASPARPTAGLTPVGVERIETVDILRGFALLGILIVNMQFFQSPFDSDFMDSSLWPAAHDRAAHILISTFATGKFYSLFSLLFGFGAATMLARAEAHGARFGPLFRRRMLVLLCIGVLHGTLIWYGDILTCYALIGGLLLPLFLRRKLRTLLVAAVLALLVMPLLLAGLTVASELSRGDPIAAEEERARVEKEQAAMSASVADTIRVFRTGTFAEITARRTSEYLRGLGFTLFGMGPSILAMFLLGVYAARTGVLRAPLEHAAVLRRILIAGLLIGLPGNVAFALLDEMVSQSRMTWLLTFTYTLFSFAAPALMLAYAAGIVLFTMRPGSWRWLNRLAPVGRMALTNYLLQSLICSTIFSAYGLGLYGSVGPALGVPLTFGIYAMQIPLSAWWLRRYRFGPAEWLWRSLTYGARQPLRIATG